jgi:NADH:ubiquinone oxidoreductase subunit 6 (subunit J)
MSLADFIFYFFIALTAMAAIGILVVKNVFHAALLLIGCLLSIAGIYVLLHAEFLAVTQIMIYAGGILVLIIFGVMLSSRIAGKPLLVEDSRKASGYLVGAGVLFILTYTIYTATFSFSFNSQQLAQNPVKEVGFLLMSNFVAPFEAAGILLLISLIGAAVTASFLNKKEV